jgi:3-isopropylmalate/(R)-2-methylmalate dehydratase small subunit
LILKGKVHKFGENINTDYIISGRYKFKTLDLNELAKHVMEDIAPGFYGRIEPGDFIVAGQNFGCGSSREQAPLAIKYAKIAAVLAPTFARIFYRNAINIGLPVIEVDTSQINDGDELEVDLEKGTIKDLTNGLTLKIKPLPEVMIKILNEGGLVDYIKKFGSF